jgi:phage baseplate assembly protein W
MGARIVKDNEEYKQSGASYEVYSDFTHTFLPHPNTGQVTRRTNIDAVKMAIRNLVLTNKYERLRNPTFGGNIRRYLFEPFIAGTAPEIESNIKSLIETYEPRAKVISVKAIPQEDQNAMIVNIQFYVVISEQEQEMNLTLYRVR